jgi:hypothetical protein
VSDDANGALKLLHETDDCIMEFTRTFEPRRFLGSPFLTRFNFAQLARQGSGVCPSVGGIASPHDKLVGAFGPIIEISHFLSLS